MRLSAIDSDRQLELRLWPPFPRSSAGSVRDPWVLVCSAVRLSGAYFMVRYLTIRLYHASIWFSSVSRSCSEGAA